MPCSHAIYISAAALSASPLCYAPTATLTSRQLNLCRVWSATGSACGCRPAPAPAAAEPLAASHAAIKFKCKTKGMLFDISQSCRAAGRAQLSLPCHALRTFCRLSCCFMCNIFTTLRRQQQRHVQNALSSDKWQNATTATTTTTAATYNNN